MATYWTYTEGRYNYLTLSDGRKYRAGMRSGQFVDDWELVVGGFLLAENVGWENLSKGYNENVNTKYREGLTDDDYAIEGYSGGVWSAIEY